MFSTDYDLTFIPSICALLVFDRGNWMIHQIKLPSGDYVQHSGSGIQIHWVTPIIASRVSFLLGLLVMVFSQPYIAAHTRRLWYSSSNVGLESIPNNRGQTSDDELFCHVKHNC